MRKHITVGFQMSAHLGTMQAMREAWMDAEELGADSLYSSDHIIAIAPTENSFNQANDGSFHNAVRENCFEATVIQTAMAATTTRAEIGCLCYANGYRDPNMLAYMAGSIDHLSRGRFVLGIGTGYAKEDFEEFGYEYGSQADRSLALDRNIPIILDRFAKLCPQPVRRIPIMIASSGGKIGLRTVAKYADIWHVYGPYQKMVEKAEMLKGICKEVGRNIDEIEFATFYIPGSLKGSEDTLDNYVKMGIKRIIVLEFGSNNWDRGLLREVLAWRNALK